MYSSRRSATPISRPVYRAVLVLLALAALPVGRVLAQTTYGTLSNFDVFNDTGQECHGFEIELDGLSSTDISYTFGSTYQRYGDPKVVDFPGGVYVRYESPYDPANHVFTQATPLAPSVISPTDGHACWTGGSANYLTSGCEHFGVGMNRNPTNTVYRWLIADPANPGALQPSGTKVSIPAPIWNVAPPPQPGVPPVVQAVLPAEPPEVNQEYGDAHWVKVFVTESPDAAELHHLLSGDPPVPQEPGETEMEWVLLQAGPPGKNGNNELVGEGQAGAHAESVTRRYEFYEYTGAYDPESHEALCADGHCNAPAEGELGNYIGAQMAAVNLSPLGPNLRVAAKQVRRKAYAGCPLRYRARIENRGPGVATAATVSVTLAGLPPADTATIRASKGCSISGAVVTCPLGDLDPQATRQKTVSVRPSARGTIAVTADAASSAPGTRPGQSTITTVVQ